VKTHSHRVTAIVCVGLALIDGTLAAQQSQQPIQPASQSISAAAANGQGVRRVPWPPHSADEVTVITRTLADGTKITRTRLVKQYWDSQGRRREEWFNDLESAGQDDTPQWVRIFDPPARAFYSLNPRDHTAQRTELSRPVPSPVRQTPSASATLSPARPVPPQPTREDLGTQVIEGFEARGTRTTRTIPEGAEGNDRPIQITEEVWSSTSPPLLLMRITKDPRSEMVMHLTNIVLDEPPAELFQVPSDYTLQELQPVTKPEPLSD